MSVWPILSKRPLAMVAKNANLRFALLRVQCKHILCFLLWHVRSIQMPIKPQMKRDGVKIDGFTSAVNRAGQPLWALPFDLECCNAIYVQFLNMCFMTILCKSWSGSFAFSLNTAS